MSRMLVFDMGGVLYDFQGDRLIACSSRRQRRWRSEEVQALWVPLVHAFETGRCSEADFAAAVIERYDLSLEPAAFLAEFRNAAAGLYEGALGLLSELGRRHCLVSLSNTNALQWPRVLEDLGPNDPFQAHYPSHVSGFHKPDARAFTWMAAEHAAASEFYFFAERGGRPRLGLASRASPRRGRSAPGVREARLDRLVPAWARKSVARARASYWLARWRGTRVRAN